MQRFYNSEKRQYDQTLIAELDDNQKKTLLYLLKADLLPHTPSA
jgi:hypothetical protein